MAELKPPVKTPCKGCPFSKTGKAGELGGSPVETYIGQVHLPMYLPCHAQPNYAGKQCDVTVHHQCSGAARFRKKLLLKAKAKRVEELGVPEAEDMKIAETFGGLGIQDDPDGKAFDTIEEFCEHHTGKKFSKKLPEHVIQSCMDMEMSKLTDEHIQKVKR